MKDDKKICIYNWYCYDPDWVRKRYRSKSIYNYCKTYVNIKRKINYAKH